MKLHKTVQPLKKGVARVPVIMQMEARECGAISLAMVLAYYKKWITPEQAQADCNVGRDGASIRSLMRAAENYGLKAERAEIEAGALQKNGTFPCVIRWKPDRFVVLCGFRRGRAVINDPAKGNYAVPAAFFAQNYGGVCITLVPDDAFAPGGKPRSVLAYAWKSLKGTKREIALVAAAALLGAAFGVIRPAFSRIFLDRLLTGENPEWLGPFLAALAAVSVLQLTVLCVQTIYRYRINGKLAAAGSGSYMWKILRMPMEFFSQRMAGDLQQRQIMSGEIAGSLAQTLVPLALNGIMMLLYLLVMLRYSVPLALLGLSATVLNSAVSRYISKKRMNATRLELRDGGKLAGMTVAGMEMIENIKASGAENGYFELWAGYQAGANAQRVRFVRLSQYLGLIPAAVSGLTGLAVLALGVYFVMEGQFTVGALLAFQGLLNSFSAPADSLVDAAQTLQEMRLEIDLVENVMEYPSDPVCEEKPLREDREYSKMSGSVELRDVTFG